MHPDVDLFADLPPRPAVANQGAQEAPHQPHGQDEVQVQGQVQDVTGEWMEYLALIAGIAYTAAIHPSLLPA